MHKDSLNTNSSSPLSQLEIHEIGFFDEPILKRKESLEYTLNLFNRVRPDFLSILSRTSHLYPDSTSTLENVKKALSKNLLFTKVEVKKETSDIGIGYKLVAHTKDGRTLSYDGFLFRISKVIHEESFELKQLKSLTRSPLRSHDCSLALLEAIRSIFPNIAEDYQSSLSFYSANIDDWENIGLKGDADSALRLKIIDENIIRMSNLKHFSRGKEYNVYLSSKDEPMTSIHLIAHDMALNFEVSFFTTYIYESRKRINEIKKFTSKNFHSENFDFFRYSKTYNKWLEVKNAIRDLLTIQSNLQMLQLVWDGFQDIIKEKIAFANAPVQIWLGGEDRTVPTMNQYPRVQFTEAILKDNTIKEITLAHIEPIYTRSVNSSRELNTIVSNEAVKEFNTTKELLNVVQSEISIYSLWIAAVACILSALSVIVALLTAGK